MLKKQLIAISVIAFLPFLGGCQKSVKKQQQKAMTHLNAQTADFASHATDDLCVYAKICDAKENRYYFGKRKLPFDVLKLTFDNQSEKDYKFDPKASHLALTDNAQVAKAIHPRARGAYAIGLAPVAMGAAATGALFMNGGPAIIGASLFGPLWCMAGIGILAWAAIAIPSSVIYKKSHHLKNKKAITKNVDNITQPIFISAGQTITTFLFLERSNNDLSTGFRINTKQVHENGTTETLSNLLVSPVIK